MGKVAGKDRKSRLALHQPFSLGLTEGRQDCATLASLSSLAGEGNGTPLQYSCRKIPWMEEPGGLQSMGSRRVGHD